MMTFICPWCLRNFEVPDCWAGAPNGTALCYRGDCEESINAAGDDAWRAAQAVKKNAQKRFLKSLPSASETKMVEYKNPVPTVDIVIFGPNYEIVLIKRKNPPHGYALPGGFVDEGESFEQAAVREAKEETNLDVTLQEQFYTYSDPKRDPRKHITSTVYIGYVEDWAGLKALDDASEIVLVDLKSAKDRADLAFDHRKIIEDVYYYIEYSLRPSFK